MEQLVENAPGVELQIQTGERHRKLTRSSDRSKLLCISTLSRPQALRLEDDLPDQ